MTSFTLGDPRISNLFYVATWEVVYFMLMPDFADKYAAHMIERGEAICESIWRESSSARAMIPENSGLESPGCPPRLRDL